MAVVYLNGVKTGLITTSPFEISLPANLKTDENTLSVEVIGSLKNTFGFLYKSSTGRWIIGPGDWDVAPATLPSLDQYFLLGMDCSNPSAWFR